MFEIGRLTRLALGYESEGNSRPIEICVADWLADWPGATIGLLLMRPGEETYYPAAIKVLDGVLHFTPSRADMAIPGDGLAQIVLTDENDVELRSRVVRTMIECSLPGSEAEAPEEPMRPFVDQVLEAAASAAESAASAGKAAGNAEADAGRAEAAADNAEAAAKRAEEAAGMIGPGGGGTGTVTSVNGVQPDEAGNVVIDIPQPPTKLEELEDDADHRLVTDTEKAAWNAKSTFSGKYADLSGKPTIPTKLSEMAADATHRLVTDTEKSTWNAKSTFSGKYADLTGKPTIPNVPSWALQSTKPTYTAAEVGALPSTYTPPNQTATQVGADPAGTAASKVSAHNADEDAHPAIRQLVNDLAGRLNALADSDDTTLDQLSEIVAYIKSNKSLIDSITTGKVSVSDIVNNLTSTATNKPLSAAQGKALKTLIDAIVVPTKVSAFENDAGYAKQQELAELAEEIADLKENAGSVGGTTIPDYVRTAAEEVAEKIISINGAAKGGASGSAGYTNQLPISTDGAGAVYNGTGWKENTRISSSGTIKDGVGANLTGYMPAKPGDVLRMQGITLGKNGVPSGYTGSFLWCFDGSYTRLGSLTRGDENGDGVFLPTESDDGILTYTIPSTYACTYIRLQVRTISDTSIITINEEINEDSGGATSGADAVPVTFAVLSDLHWNDADAPRHRSARQSMEVVSETAPVDAALFLGDLIPNWTWMSYEDAVVDISNCRKAYANLPMPSLWLRGNHDNNAYPDERISKAEIYTRIARRQHNVWVSNSADPYGCYGYMDFDASKVRIICVNTSDNDQFYPKTPPNAESIGGLLGAINVTATQLQWIADVALDFSDKTDPAAWGIVVASHIPISLYPDNTYTGDDGVTWECKIQTVSALINAYVNGTTFSATVNEETANADFSSVENRAEMICFVSGHKHAMLSGTINGFLDVVCPNVSSAGEKVSTDGNTYAKTAIGTVGETAVSFISIDRANRKIHAFVYGSGYDREYNY